MRRKREDFRYPSDMTHYTRRALILIFVVFVVVFVTILVFILR